MSEEFEEAFSSHSCGLVRECKCGRTHFNAVDSNGYYEGELDSLLESARLHPDKYTGHDGDQTDITILGTTFVVGCPCGGVERAERAIWNSRYRILDYLRRMAVKREEDLHKLKNAIKGADNE